MGPRELTPQLQQYAEDVGTCRHVRICQYFGEQIAETNPETVLSYCDGMCDVCSNRAGVYLAAQDLTEEFPTLSPIEPVPPSPSVSLPVRERAACSFADMHDEPAWTERPWTSVFSPVVEESSGGIDDGPANDKEEDGLGSFYDDPDPDADDSSAPRRRNQSPLFDLPSSFAEPVQDAPQVVDLSRSSSPTEEVGLKNASFKKEAPSSSVATTAREATRPPHVVPRRRSILQAIDTNDYSQPQARSSRLRTIDELAEEGFSGAIIVGQPRSPGHSKRKEREREKAFKDIAPLSNNEGPYSFYNSAAPKKKHRIEKRTFKAPGPAISEPVPPSSHATGTTAGHGAMMLCNTPPPAGSLAPESITDRKSGMARLLAAIKASFEEGQLAEEVLVAWKRKEEGEQR